MKKAIILLLLLCCASILYAQTTFDGWTKIYDGWANGSFIDSQGNIWLLAKETVLVSTDHGSTWNQTNYNVPTRDGTGPVGAAAELGNEVFVSALDHGIWVTSDKGTSWTYTGVTQSYGTGSNDMLRVGNELLAGYAGSTHGLFKWNSSNNSWVQKYSGDNFNWLNLDKFGRVWASSFNTLYISTDVGETWTVNANFSSTANGFEIAGDSIIVLTTTAEYFSTDLGTTWNNTTYPSGLTGSMKYVPQSRRLYASGSNALYYSDDFGASWSSYTIPDGGSGNRIQRYGNTLLWGTSVGLFSKAIDTSSLAQGLVAYYPFNGNANDESGNGYNGTIHGASLTTDRFGNTSAFYLDGASSISVPGFNAKPQNFSVSLWFQATSNGDAGNRKFVHLCDVNNRLAYAWTLGWFTDPSNPPNTVLFQLNWTPSGSLNVPAGNVLQNGRWYHVVSLWDGNKAQVYIDGQLVVTDVVTPSTISYPSVAGLYIGYDSQMGYYQGKLDDIRIYNRVLSQTEIDSLYHEGGWGSGNLSVLVQNGEDWGLAGSNAHVRLYTNSGVLFDSATTNTNSIATFTGVPAGDGYYYLVDYVSTHPHPVVTRQYWGQRNGISITAGQTTSDIFTRNMPYATVIHVYNSLTNEDVSSKPVWPGTPLRVDLSAKNPSYTDAQTQSVKGRLILDTNSTPPYILDETGNYVTIPVGTTATMIFPYSPSTPGQYYYAGGLEVSLNGTDTYSEGFDDWKNPFFSVVTPVVALLAPADNASSQSTSLTLRWNHVNGTSTYQVQLGSDTAFSSPIVNDSTVTDTTRQVLGLSNGAIYYWRVRAISPGTKSAYAVPFSFTTVVTTPGVPTLVSPADGAPSQPMPVTVRWNTVASAIGYHVQVSSDPQFGSFFVNDSTVTDTTRLMSGLTNNTTYYWRVRTINSGGKSAFSTPYTFTTVVALPGVPALLSPSDGATTQPIALNLRWSRVTGASAYHVQVSSDAPFSALVVNDSTLADTTKVVSGLANNTTYYWRVQATNAGGKSAYATPYSFSTVVAIPGTPALLLPLNGAASEPVSLILQWTRVIGAVGYQVQLSSDGFFGSFLVNDSTLIDTLRLVSGLENNTTYYWRARALNAGGTSGFTTPFSFATIIASPSQVQLVQPTNGANIGQDSTQFVWNGSTPEISSYEFSLIGDTTTVLVTSDTALSVKIPANSIQKSYSWHVRAKNLAGFGLLSDTWTFTRLTTTVNMPGGIPKTYALYQNYPNPFNPTTRIRYALPMASNVTLTVYNTLGQVVLTVKRGLEPPGYHEVNVDGNNMASGVYFYRLQAGSFAEVRKLLLLK